MMFLYIRGKKQCLYACILYANNIVSFFHKSFCKREHKTKMSPQNNGPQNIFKSHL